MPGLRGRPAVTMTMSESAVASYPLPSAPVVALLKTGSAYFAPSAAAARMARAVAEDSGAVLPVCAWVDGEYGISGVYLGVEAEIGREGVRRVVEGDLTESELAALREAAEAVRAKQADVADL